MRKILVMSLFAVAAVGAYFAMSSKPVQAAESIKIGVEGAYKPFSYMENGQLKGFDIEIAQALCKAMDVKCELVAQDWDGIIPGLLAGKYDAIIASMAITDERKKKVDFTNKYYHSGAQLVVSETIAPAFASLNDQSTSEDILKVYSEALKGKAIGIQRGTIYDKFFSNHLKNVDLKLYDTQENVINDLAAGRVVAYLDDKVMIETFLKGQKPGQFVAVGPVMHQTDWFGVGAGIAIRKNEEALKQKLNDAIKKIREDGTYKKINDQYFSFDIYGD